MRKKKNNTPYTQEQEFFIRYHVVDLAMEWKAVQERYMAWFPQMERTTGALTCEYYRTNKQIPVIENGLLVFGPPRKATEGVSKQMYRGVHFLCKEYQCRKDKIHSLLEIFPEEIEDLNNKWILPQHRGLGKEAAERRRYQRESWTYHPKP